MEHLAEIEFIEYLAGHLTERRIAEVQEHLAECPQCSQRIEQAQKLSDALGAWEVDTAGHGVVDRVIALAQESRPKRSLRPSTRDLMKMFMPQALRVAASIVIAIGLGHKLGEYSVEGRKPQTASSSERPQYLAALGLEWSSGLAWLVLEEDPADAGSGQ
ncbi:MAG: zf-HC2 domain-containing protein [Phycisphaerales bacterium]|nr:MAG: zf-HC2 domain-containing protein [Phycisphaerales bacterium]